MKFAFLGYSLEKNWDALSKSEQDATSEDCHTYLKKLLKEGHLVDKGAALQPSRTARTLRWQNGAVVVTDGPYAETKEHLGGFCILEAVDMMQAVELVSKHPGLHHGATFEIWPISEEALERQARSIAALRTSSSAVNSQGSRFAGLGYLKVHGWDSIPVNEREAMMRSCIVFDEAQIKSGQWLSGIALQGPGTAKTLRAKVGQVVVVTDGPFAETKELLGGVGMRMHKDLNDAVSTLSKHPALPFGLAIEIRPIDEDRTRR